MKACVVGHGGREHALALALARTASVVVCPGSPGMIRSARSGSLSPTTAMDGGYPIEVTGRDPWNIDADLFVIGPEQLLVQGLADRLRAEGRLVFGPGSDGATLEGSKKFMRELLAEANVPSPRYGAFDELAPAVEFLRSLEGPWVVKTDGLAAGKGVLVTGDIAEAEEDAASKISGASFGDAGRSIVVEEGLSGTECSLMVVTDGLRLAPLAPAQDSKRLEDGDCGANTGGMGSFSPVPVVDDRIIDRVLDESVEPTLAALRRRGIDYRGILYAGLMLTEDGPKVLEFNVRFGDPETQVVLPRIDDDLTGLLAEAASGRLRTDPKSSADAAVCVVLAAYGYPRAPRTGDVIEGLADAAGVPGVTVLHAGTALDANEGFVTAGGRVLDVVGTGTTIEYARSSAYAATSRISWEGEQHRTDIAAGVVTEVEE